MFLKILLIEQIFNMSFVGLGHALNKNNLRLKNNLRRYNRSDRTKHIKDLKFSGPHPDELSKEMLSHSRIIYRRRVIKWFLILGFVMSVMLPLMYKLANNITVKYFPPKDYSNERSAFVEKNERMDYEVLINWGDYYLRQDQFEKALNDYTRAKSLKPNGYNANIGITKSLLQLCLQHGTYCDQTDLYLRWAESISHIKKNDFNYIRDLDKSFGR